MKILFFASIAEFTGVPHIIVNGIASVSQLKSSLHELYPGINKLKFSIAVNQRIISGDQNLFENDEVALLPPFSGG